MRTGSSDECRVEWREKANTKRSITVLTLCAMLLLLCSSTEAQQAGKVPRIGYVAGNPGSLVEAFRQGLRDLGYIEGKNILVEYRYAEGVRDRIPSLVAELVRLKLDVLVFHDTSAIHAAKQATQTIPIDMVATQDPVATGIVDSLARPGGNITGLTRLTRELSGKRLELLKEMVPGISRIGLLLGTNATIGNAGEYYEAAARALKILLQSLAVKGPNPDLEGVFRDAAKARVTALVTVTSQLFARYRKPIATLAIQNRWPSMYEQSSYVEAGGLVSYAANEAESFKRAAVYVDKILKGTKPADLPVEQPKKFEFIVNLKAAKQIGLTIPPNVLVRADKVIK